MNHLCRRVIAGISVMMACNTHSLLYAQDTIRITLPQTEGIFLEKNLGLLAEKYNISIAEAQVVQSKLYPNPNFAISGNLYNPERKKMFDVGNNTGQYTIDVQQLVLLANAISK